MRILNRDINNALLELPVERFTNNVDEDILPGSSIITVANIEQILLDIGNRGDVNTYNTFTTECNEYMAVFEQQVFDAFHFIVDSDSASYTPGSIFQTIEVL